MARPARSESGYLGAWAGAMVGLLVAFSAYYGLGYLLLFLFFNPDVSPQAFVLLVWLFSLVAPVILPLAHAIVVLGCYLGVRSSGRAARRTTAWFAGLLLGWGVLVVVFAGLLGQVFNVQRDDLAAIAAGVVATLAFLTLPLAARWLALRSEALRPDPSVPIKPRPVHPADQEDPYRYWNA